MTRFGSHFRERWLLDPATTYLNHGTVGATPIAVLQAQQQIRHRIERQPAKTLFRELFETLPPQKSGETPLLRAAADRVGAFLGARGDDLVFLDNTTAGINAVLQSFPFEPGEAIALTTLGYGAFPGVAHYLAERRQLRVHTIDLPFPVFDPQQIVDAFADGLPDDTRMVLVDHIASATGLRLPIHAIAEVCRTRGVLLFVDGAHAPGSIELDIASIGADLYVGNLHKWMWTPRSSAILWARPELQPVLHPPVLSWGLGKGFHAEFDLVGTRDPSNHLTAPAAIDEMQALGFERIRQYNHTLAVEAGQLLADAWCTRVLASPALMGTMVAVELPRRFQLDHQRAIEFRNILLDEHQIEVQVATGHGTSWVRVAAQIYVDLDDIQRLADVVNSL